MRCYKGQWTALVVLRVGAPGCCAICAMAADAWRYGSFMRPPRSASLCSQVPSCNVFGEVRRGQYGLEIIHPEYQLVNALEPVVLSDNLTPIYPATDGVSQRLLRKLTDQALQLLAAGGVLQEILPDAVLQRFAFPALAVALQYVHRPPVDAPVAMLLEKEHSTQKRLVFEELLAHRLTLLDLKKNVSNPIGATITRDRRAIPPLFGSVALCADRCPGALFRRN